MYGRKLNNSIMATASGLQFSAIEREELGTYFCLILYNKTHFKIHHLWETLKKCMKTVFISIKF